MSRRCEAIHIKLIWPTECFVFMVNVLALKEAMKPSVHRAREGWSLSTTGTTPANVT